VAEENRIGKNPKRKRGPGLFILALAYASGSFRCGSPLSFVMKRSIFLVAALAATSLSVRAQAPLGKRSIPRHQARRADWPSVSLADRKEYPATFEALRLLLRNAGVRTARVSQTDIKRFQRAQGLQPDGVIGPQTWAKLCPRLHRGDRGEAVRALQTLLGNIQSGYDKPIPKRLAVDGNFGFSTETELRRFQRDYGLKADGVAGAQTWSNLLMPEEGD